MRRFLFVTLSVLAIAACGSSGGTSTPPAPPAPVTPTPPPPPPEPTFEERLSDLAEFDPNPCRAETPGFEALGGWLKNDGRAIGGSRVWIDDAGELSDEDSHGARVWSTFTDCAFRSTNDHYNEDGALHWESIRADGGDGIVSFSSAPFWEDIVLPEPGVWAEYPHVRAGVLDVEHDGNRDGQRLLRFSGAGNDNGKRTSHLQRAGFQLALQESSTALVILVGGYSGEGDDRAPAADIPARTPSGLTGSSLCDDAAPLCLFAPWSSGGSRAGTSHATPQVAAAMDTVWAVWPDMDVLDLRNLAFDCAENMDAPEGETATTRSYSYKNGRSFTSDTNSTWGHGILSMTCLFTPNGGLQNPVTGNAVSGGIYGPVAGPITGASIAGVDYTGRDFGYGFARPVARENFALASLTQAAPRGGAATANLSAVQPFSGHYARTYAPGAFRGRLWQRGTISLDLSAWGNALGTVAVWQLGGLTLQGGLAIQPEGVGSLTGSRSFRAPYALSAAITAAYGKVLPHGFSAHLQAGYWRTLATYGRSLWESAQLSEERLTAALVKRIGAHEFALQAAWQSGLAGSLSVNGRSWDVSPQAKSGVLLTWKQFR